MEKDENEIAGVREKHLRVPVLPEEKAAIEALARRAGRSVARYLREVGLGHQVTEVVDAEQVGELVRVNADLARLGNLLKMWLSRDPRTSQVGENVILAALERVNSTQVELSAIMQRIVRPRSAS